MILLGHGENSIYLIHQELTKLYKDKIEIIPVIADVQDGERIQEIVNKYQPYAIYHALLINMYHLWNIILLKHLKIMCLEQEM